LEGVGGLKGRLKRDTENVYIMGVLNGLPIQSWKIVSIEVLLESMVSLILILVNRILIESNYFQQQCMVLVFIFQQVQFIVTNTQSQTQKENEICS
jgi:hypothetical protein